MIPTNSTELLPKLDGIRQKRHKFLCLNDDLNHTNPEAKRVIKVVQDLLRTLFPDPSPFELGPGVYNKHLWVQDYLDEYVLGVICLSSNGVLTHEQTQRTTTSQSAQEELDLRALLGPVRGALHAGANLFGRSATQKQTRTISARVTLSQSTQRVNKEMFFFISSA
jgi:hypothetical protein